MRRALLVAFSGVDGAGKSTQIERLCEGLRSEGRPARVIWARGGYTAGFETLKTILRRLRPHSLPTQGRSAARSERFRSKRVRKVWLALAILDLIGLWAIGVRLTLLRGRTVVADRYLPDTLIDFRLNFPEERVSEWWLWRLLCQFAPIPDHHFVLLVPVEESERRSRQKNEPFPDPPEILTQRLEQYERVATMGPVVRVDGGRSRDEVWGEISRHLGGRE